MAAEVATTSTVEFSVLSSDFPNVLGGAYKCVLTANIETREDSRKYPDFFFRSSKPLFVKTEDINRMRDALEAYSESEKDWRVTSEFEGIANDACIEFCNTHSLISDLRKCLNKAEIMFPNRQSLSAEYDRFNQDEYEEDGHVVIRIEVSSGQEAAFKEYDVFTDWMLDNITDDNLDSFVVRVSLI